MPARVHWSGRAKLLEYVVGKRAGNIENDQILSEAIIDVLRIACSRVLPVCTENLIRVDAVMESLKLAE
jgi:hypothetical protein